MRRTVDGAEQVFCCYGCCIAYQVLRGHGEESEATWLLIRLGIGGFLSMNVMTFSLVIYSGGFEGMDAGLLPGCICCCGCWRRPCCSCSAGRSSATPGGRRARASWAPPP